MIFRNLWARMNTVRGERVHPASFTEMGFRVEAASRSDAGGRDENEDYCMVRVPAEGEPAYSHGWLAIVSDGMGGHNAGDRASRLAVDCVVKEYYESIGPPASSLRSAVFSANRSIRKEARRSKLLSGMGATCTVLVGLGDRAVLAHVGDSRLYLLRGGTISQLTEDHSVTMDMVRRGLLEPGQAKQHREHNVVLRALGGEPQVEVAEWDTPLAVLPGDRFILCTDGLSNVLEDEDILSAASDLDCKAACDSLMALAETRQPADNVTAIVVDVFSKDNPATAEQVDSQVISEVTS